MANLAEKDTVAIYFVNAALTRLGDDQRATALLGAGIPAELLSNPQARVPANAFAALWRSIAMALDDEFFGLDRRRMKPGSFALLCHSVLDCGTLEHALRRALRGMRLFLDDVFGEMTLENQHAVLTVQNRISNPADRLFADETYLTLMHGLMCWLIGKRVALDCVAFACPRPTHAREYTRMFSGTLLFDAPHASIRFATHALWRPIAQNAGSLQRFLRSTPQSVFLKYRNEDSWSIKLRRRLRASVGQPDWPVLDVLADEVGISATTLRRRLEAEGNSYQNIKDQLRNDLAIELLSNSAMNIDDMAAQLGFHDASSFHRAFRRWNGLQPGEYRQRVAAAYDDPTMHDEPTQQDGRAAARGQGA